MKFEKLAKVSFSDEYLKRCSPEEQRRFTGRVGTIKGYRLGAEDPIVYYPKDGRRREVTLYELQAKRLRLVVV